VTKKKGGSSGSKSSGAVEKKDTAKEEKKRSRAAHTTPLKARGKRPSVGPSPASLALRRNARPEEVTTYEEVERLSVESPTVLATTWGGASSSLQIRDLASALGGKFVFGGVLGVHTTLINEYLRTIRGKGKCIVVASPARSAYLPCASVAHHGNLDAEQLRRFFFRSEESSAHLLETSQIPNLRVADIDVLILIVCIHDKHFVVDAIDFVNREVLLMDSAVRWTTQHSEYSEPEPVRRTTRLSLSLSLSLSLFLP